MVQPGAVSCPYHFHRWEEEVFYVVSGQGILLRGPTVNDFDREI